MTEGLPRQHTGVDLFVRLKIPEQQLCCVPPTNETCFSDVLVPIHGKATWVDALLQVSVDT